MGLALQAVAWLRRGPGYHRSPRHTHCPFLGEVRQRQALTGHLKTAGANSPQEDWVAFPDQGLLRAVPRPSEHGQPAPRSHWPVGSTKCHLPPALAEGEWLTPLLPCLAESMAIESASLRAGVGCPPLPGLLPVWVLRYLHGSKC